MFKYLKIIKSMMTDESQWWRYVRATPFLRLMPDKYYLKRWYKFRTGNELNLKNPQTFNEKLQWLKLYNRNPEYTKMVDKYEVKQYIKKKLGQEYVIPVIGGPWRRFCEIDFTQLPNQFVLKTTHDSGGTFICKDKTTFDKLEIENKLEYSLNHNYFYYGREWPYKNVKPRIFAEKYMEELGKKSLFDYKIHCFHGKAKLILVCMDRNDTSGIKKIFYDEKWNKLNMKRVGASNDCDANCPKNIEKMIEFSERLSKDIPFVRVDFYDINDRLYFGEMTFFPGGGMEKFDPPEWDSILGDYIQLPLKNF